MELVPLSMTIVKEEKKGDTKRDKGDCFQNRRTIEEEQNESPTKGRKEKHRL